MANCIAMLRVPGSKAAFDSAAASVLAWQRRAPRVPVSPSPYSVLSRPDARVLLVVQLDARIKAVRRGVLLVQALRLLACRRIPLVIDWDRRIALVIDREPSMHHEEPLPSSLFRRPMIRSD